MKNWTRKSEFSSIGTDEDADETVEETEDDAEEGDEFIDDDTGVDGAEDEGGNADEGEETDGYGREGVGRRGEEECEGCPVRGRLWRCRSRLEMLGLEGDV